METFVANRRQILGKLDQLKSVCLTQSRNAGMNKEDLMKTGQRIYNLMSQRAKQQLKTLNSQQRLLDKQNRQLSEKKVSLDNVIFRKSKTDSEIQKLTRMLMYNNQIYSQQDWVISLLKTLVLISIFILVINIILHVYR